MRAMRLFVALAVAAMVATPDGSAVAGGAGMAFEDRNNNGAFDAGDRDITAELIESSVFVTTESVVFVGKTLQSPKRGYTNGFTVLAGKNITIEASLNGGGFGSTLLMTAENISVGDGVKLEARNFVTLSARNALTLGDGVSLRSAGDIGLSSARGHIVVGEKLNVSSSELGIYVSAIAGAVTIGEGAKMSCRRASLSISARQGITANRINLTAESVSLFTATGGIESMHSKFSARGEVSLNAMGSGVDVEASQFSTPPDIG